MSKTKKVFAYSTFFKCECEVARELPNGDVLYKDLLTPLANYIKDSVKGGNNQIVVLVVGRTGSGKSNDAIQLCTKIDPCWQINGNYIYSNYDFTKKLKAIRNGEKPSLVNLFDEGSVALNSMNSMRKEDNTITVAFDTLRSFGMVSVICIPNERHLNKRMGENHLDFMIKVPNVPPIKGYGMKGFANLYVHRYRDWAEPYWDPIGTTLVEKVPVKVWKEYSKIKLEHQWEFIDKMDDGEKK